MHDTYVSENQVDVIFINFAMSFDKINYHVFSDNLHSTGIRDPFLSWMT